MSVTLFLMSAGVAMGGTPGCDGCPPAAPVMVHAAPVGGCGCEGGGGLFSGLRNRFGGKPLLFGCGGFKKDDCDPCATAGPRQGLLSRLRDKLGCGQEPCPAACDPCAVPHGMVGGCDLPAVPGVPAVGQYAAPQAMPHTSYTTPQSAPPVTYSPAQAAPQAMPAPAPMPTPEPMPKPAEVAPGKVRSEMPRTLPPAVGIPSVEVPRI